MDTPSWRSSPPRPDRPLREERTKGSGIESYVKAIKSWMVWNDIETPKSIRIYGALDYNKYENEVPPRGWSSAGSSTSPRSG